MGIDHAGGHNWPPRLSDEVVNGVLGKRTTKSRTQYDSTQSTWREPKMDFDDLDSWVWALRFKEPDWPRDPKTNIPFYIEVPVELPEGKCLFHKIGRCHDKIYTRNYCCADYYRLKREENDNLTLRYRTTARRKQCKSKKCFKRTNHYIDYCDQCQKKRTYNRGILDPTIDRRTTKPSKKTVTQARREYNERRRAFRAARAAERAAQRREMEEYARLVDPAYFAPRPPVDPYTGMHAENQRRVADAAEATCILLERALVKIGRESINPQTLEAVELRLKYPHDSLRQLAERANPPMTKDQLQGRLRRFLAKA